MAAGSDARKDSPPGEGRRAQRHKVIRRLVRHNAVLNDRVHMRWTRFVVGDWRASLETKVVRAHVHRRLDGDERRTEDFKGRLTHARRAHVNVSQDGGAMLLCEIEGEWRVRSALWCAGRVLAARLRRPRGGSKDGGD